MSAYRSHELHDGLGGSIVRSMILVDQSTQPTVSFHAEIAQR